MPDDTPIPLNLRFDIEVLPSLHTDGYMALISAWLDEKDKSRCTGPLNASLEDTANWIAARVRAHILHCRADMEAGKALWMERTAALKDNAVTTPANA